MSVGVIKGPRFGSVLGYYCPNCYYGVKDFEKLKCDMDKCPNCGIKLNFEKLV